MYGQATTTTPAPATVCTHTNPAAAPAAIVQLQQQHQAVGVWQARPASQPASQAASSRHTGVLHLWVRCRLVVRGAHAAHPAIDPAASPHCLPPAPIPTAATAPTSAHWLTHSLTHSGHASFGGYRGACHTATSKPTGGATRAPLTHLEPPASSPVKAPVLTDTRTRHRDTHTPHIHQGESLINFQLEAALLVRCYHIVSACGSVANPHAAAARCAEREGCSKS